MFDLEKLKLKTLFDKNKHIHKFDLELLMDTFFYYVTDLWRGYERKKDVLMRLYKRFNHVIDKILKNDEIPNSKKYLFYYFLLNEEILNKKYYFFKNDENFKKIYKEFVDLILLSYEKDGFLTIEEFFIEVEKIKSRFEKEIKEILNEVEKFTYASRKKNYKEIQQYFIKKLKERK